MRYLAVIGALWFLATSISAHAQLQVSAQTERTNFLLFERVDFLVTLTNVSGSDITLSNDDGQPWLSFLVSRRVQHNDLPIRQERKSFFKTLILKAGDSKILRVNLTPLFTFREEGDYRASAVINLPAQGQIISDNVPFAILNGRQVWSQIHPVDGSQRIYSLIRFSPHPDITNLYLRVEDPAKNIVYANLGLGEVVSFVDPDAFFDPEGNLHIMHPIAMATYLYTRADADGKIVHQGIFKTFHEVPPRLRKLDDGNIIVVGGLEQNPNTPRDRLSEDQIAQKPAAMGNEPDAVPVPPTPSTPSHLPAK